MVYSNRFVMCVLVDGKPQNELANSVVPVPLSTEYGLRFRNKHDRRAVVKFTIDGENVSGNGYILPANNYVDVFRHFAKDAAFKFVALNSNEAVDFGKNGPNTDGSKGVIEAHFYLEKEKPPVTHHYHHWNVPPVIYHNPFPCYTIGNQYGANLNTYNCSQSGISQTTNLHTSGIISNDCAKEPLELTGVNFAATETGYGIPALKEGCTVEGTITNQNFQSQWIEVENDYVTLKVVLQGFEKMQTEAVAIDTTHCTECGAKRIRHSDKFCGQCGYKY